MLWFRYRWVLTFSHGLCVKIIRGSAKINQLDRVLNSLDDDNITKTKGRQILAISEAKIGILDDVLFSSAALLYREESKLIGFGKWVNKAAGKLIRKLEKEKGKYGANLEKLKKARANVNKKRRNNTKRLERKTAKDKTKVEEDEKAKEEILAALHELTGFIEELDYDVHDLHLDAKAINREALNVYKIKENVIIRSNFRISELMGREGIELGALENRIPDKLKALKEHFKDGECDEKGMKALLKECRMEAEDLEHVFDFVRDLTTRTAGKVSSFKKRIGTKLQDPELKSVKVRKELESLDEGCDEVKKKIGNFRKRIQSQYRKLDNEFDGAFKSHNDMNK